MWEVNKLYVTSSTLRDIAKVTKVSSTYIYASRARYVFLDTSCSSSKNPPKGIKTLQTAPQPRVLVSINSAAESFGKMSRPTYRLGPS